MTLSELIADLDNAYDIKRSVYESLEVSDTVGFQLISGLLEVQLQEFQDIIIKLKMIERDLKKESASE